MQRAIDSRVTIDSLIRKQLLIENLIVRQLESEKDESDPSNRKVTQECLK